jgi:hypothetical protein
MEAVLCVTANLGADWQLGVITRTPLYHAHVRFYQVQTFGRGATPLVKLAYVA